MPSAAPGKEAPLQQPWLGRAGWGAALWGPGGQLSMGQPCALAARMASNLLGCTKSQAVD